MKFSQEIIQEIGHYVYLYIDPFTNKPFYVGKGQGNRVFDHLSRENSSAIFSKIKEIRKKGSEPRIELLRYGLTEKESALVEASVIDLIGIQNLKNNYRGNHSRSFGRVSVEDIIIELTAEPVEVKHRVILIKINKTFRSDMSPEELYEATRGIWVVGEKREKVEFAFAVYHGIVREVYKIQKWYPAGSLNYKYRKISALKNKNRWEFEGIPASEEIRELYIHKSVKEYFNKGSQNPIRYINV
jgi:hypothetical protein